MRTKYRHYSTIKVGKEPTADHPEGDQADKLAGYKPHTLKTALPQLFISQMQVNSRKS